MFVIKGFMPHAQFANNTKGVTAPFGEISTLALTFSREKGFYKSDYSADTDLITFTVAQNNAFVKLTQQQVDHIVQVVSWVYQRSLDQHGELFSDQLYRDILAAFPATVGSLIVGDVIQDNNGYWMPASLTWTARNVPGIDASNSIKIWMADSTFRGEFDDFEILVVPPITNMNDFFKTSTEVKRLLAATTPSQTMQNIEIAKNGNPETLLRAETYTYHDVFDTTVTAQATFNVIIYGAAGNNIDSINDAIANYLLNNSTHSRTDWIKVLPDIFKRTEFIIIPLWSQMAIPNRQLQSGINSPTTNLKKVVALVKQLVPSYPSAHIDVHLEVSSHPYKSLAFAIIGSVDNRNAWFEMTDVFPDYIDVTDTSNDFARMSLATQSWARLLYDMIYQAESMDKYTSVPVTMSKVTRNNVLYLVGRYDNINYLVAAKANFVTS